MWPQQDSSAPSCSYFGRNSALRFHDHEGTNSQILTKPRPQMPKRTQSRRDDFNLKVQTPKPCHYTRMGVSEIKEYRIMGGPYNKDPTI